MVESVGAVIVLGSVDLGGVFRLSADVVLAFADVVAFSGDFFTGDVFTDDSVVSFSAGLTNVTFSGVVSGF